MKFIKYILCFVIVFACGFVTGTHRQRIFQSVRQIFKPTVTVLMSTYNRGNIVGPAIESVLNQTYTDFEFIIIDDGSTDHTAEVVQSYARKDDRIVFLKNETNKGLIYSLNRGLDKARGKYIARMDDDDLSLPWRLSRQANAMDSYPDITILGGRLIDENTHVLLPKHSPQIEDPDKIELLSYTSSALAHPTIMIRKEFLDLHNIRYKPDNLYAEDCGLYADILNAGGKISVLTEPLLRFGVVKNLKRPDKYYDTQQKTFIKIQREKLKPLLDLPKELEGSFLKADERCLFWKLVSDANKEKNILNQKKLETLMQEICPSDTENTYFTKHTYWSDFLIRESKDRFMRFQSKDRAAVVNETPETITLKWDHYGTETFKKNGKRLELINSEQRKD